MFFAWFLIKLLIPDVSTNVRKQIRNEKNSVDELMSFAKRHNAGVPSTSYIRLDGLTAANSALSVHNENNSLSSKSSIMSSQTTLTNDGSTVNYSHLSKSQAPRKRHASEEEMNNLKESRRASKKYLRLHKKLYSLSDKITTEEAEESN